jgi:transcriptional regulator GlxA family with amidase domain
MAPHRVVALALEPVVLLDLAAPAHLFGHWGANRYSFVLAGTGGKHAMTSSGFAVDVQVGLEALSDAQTIVVPGYLGTERRPDESALRELRRAAGRGARVMSICTGAFALAHAGLLDGRRATTHWDSAAEFAAQFPAVQLDPGVLYVDEGQILTSAGVAAGLDLCLHVIRRDHGAEMASHIARHCVIAPHREGGQAQFIERPLELLTSGALRLGPTLDWAMQRLEQPLTVADLARHACVSPRTFARRFRAETGSSPIQWLLAQRVLRAQELLEAGDASIYVVARHCGFADTAALRYHFRRAVGTTPTAYRRSFQAGREASRLGVAPRRAMNQDAARRRSPRSTPRSRSRRGDRPAIGPVYISE